MNSLKLYARMFYGLGIAGLGILHFIYPGFRPVILPVPPEATAQLNVLIYITGAFLFITGSLIAFGKSVKPVSLLLGIVLLLFFLLGHLPNRLMDQPANPGAWTDALKLLALSGGAFIIAEIFPDNSNARSGALSKITFLGKYFFGIMLIMFGIDHFLYLNFVKTLVPGWIPGNAFWTYFAGVALIGSGLAIILSFKRKPVSLLLGIMLLLWLILLHIPRAVTVATATDSNEIVSVLECLAFSGSSFLLYFDSNSEQLS